MIKMTLMTMIQAINSAMKQEMKKDENIVILGEDVGKDGGVFRATEGLYKQFGENRVIDTPLSELGIVGVSIGLSLGGMKPVAEIQFDGFVYGAFDQIVSHVSRLRNRSRGRYTCPFVIRVPYGGGIKALEHHSEAMEALFAHVPGIKVVIPSTPYDAKGLLNSSIHSPDPVIFFEPKKIYRSIKQEVPDESYTVDIGKAEIRQEGSDVTIVSWGSMIHNCTEAVETKKINAEIIDVRTISPLDTETIIDSVNKTGRLVIVHEAPKSFGVGAEISARINERGILSLKAPIKRVTGYDVVTPYAKLEDYNLPSKERIIAGIEEVMKF